ncbi:unnamed protein product [Lampetra planeri]
MSTDANREFLFLAYDGYLCPLHTTRLPVPTAHHQVTCAHYTSRGEARRLVQIFVASIGRKRETNWGHRWSPRFFRSPPSPPHKKHNNNNNRRSPHTRRSRDRQRSPV